MHQGQKIALVRDNEDPLTSANTAMVACALICGIPFASDKAFSDTVEMVGGKAKRTVGWIMDGTAEAEFELPDGTKENLSFSDITKRLKDDAWAEENDTHPLAYAWNALRQYRSLVGKIKTMKPMALVRKGKAFVTIAADATDEHRNKLLQLL